MDTVSVISAALVGGFSFEFVRDGVQLTVKMIKDKFKRKASDWLYDDETIKEIACHITALGFHQDESEERYIQRLENDVTLKRLLDAPYQNIVNNQGVTKYTAKNNDFVNQGVINNSVINLRVQEGQPKKS